MEGISNSSKKWRFGFFCRAKASTFTMSTIYHTIFSWITVLFQVHVQSCQTKIIRLSFAHHLLDTLTKLLGINEIFGHRRDCLIMRTLFFCNIVISLQLIVAKPLNIRNGNEIDLKSINKVSGI